MRAMLMPIWSADLIQFYCSNELRATRMTRNCVTDDDNPEGPPRVYKIPPNKEQ